MKQAILFLILTWSISTTLKAQTQPSQPSKPAVKPIEKPVYSPDLSSNHNIILKGINIQQLNDWAVYTTNGIDWIKDNISYNNTIRISNNYVSVSNQLKSQLDTLLAQDKAKWQADTAKKVKNSNH